MPLFVTAARPATATSATSSVSPTRSERRASTPATPARTSTTRITDPTRMILSAAPKVRIAHSLAAVGVWSITAEPTARTGEDAGAVKAATRWPAAIPTRVATTPKVA